MMQAVEVKPKEGLQPHWISDQAGLHRLCADLRECRQVAMDTESNSLFAYRERVCLVQISSNREDYLIDPLELDDLGCLAPVMADPAVEKIFHAAEYDIICLKRDYGMEFKNIFDTMQASRILGMREVEVVALELAQPAGCNDLLDRGEPRFGFDDPLQDGCYDWHAG